MLRGLLDRVLRRRRDEGPPLADDGSLVVVGASWDPAAADSAVLARLAGAGLDLERPLLVRHHLRLPPGALAEAARLLAQDGWALRADGAGEGPAGDGGRVSARASRAERVTGLGLAQQRSRMAGLAQRLDGDVDGWDVLAPPDVQSGAD